MHQMPDDTTFEGLVSSAAMFLGPGRVLDFGCSTGKNMIPFQQRNWKVFGLDVDAEVLRVASRYGEVIHRKDSDIALDGPVDVIVSENVLHHVPDWKADIARLADLLRPGGWFLVKEVTEDSRINRLARDINPRYRTWDVLSRFRLRELVDAAEGAGLEVAYAARKSVASWVADEISNRCGHRIPGRLRRFDIKGEFRPAPQVALVLRKPLSTGS